jgi:hypothetical protein
MIVERALYTLYAYGDTPETLKISPFPPMVIGGCKQVFNRIEGENTYRYTVYSSAPILAALILPKLVLIHEGKINFMIMAPKWWEPPEVVLGSQVWEHQAITSRQLHKPLSIAQPAHSARKVK